MQTVVVRDERPQPSSLQPVITAREVVRRYGEGDTAVDAHPAQLAVRGERDRLPVR